MTTTRTILTTTQIAAMTGVARQTVVTWIDSRKLKAFKTPGSSYRRVLLSDLIAFAKKHQMPLLMAELKK